MGLVEQTDEPNLTRLCAPRARDRCDNAVTPMQHTQFYPRCGPGSKPTAGAQRGERESNRESYIATCPPQLWEP